MSVSPSKLFVKLVGNQMVYGLISGYMLAAIAELKLKFLPYEYTPIIHINEHPVATIKREFDWLKEWPLL